LLRCLHDSGPLRVGAGATVGADRVTTGRLDCESCGGSFPIADGVADLLGTGELDEEGAFEQRVRDEWAEKPDDWTEQPGKVPRHDGMAVRAHLSMLEPLRGTCLELGCGTGRFTTHLAGRFAALLAVDFSGRSLRVLARYLDDRAPVGLVRADVTRMAVAAGRFDRCLSTLASNLPTREHRAAMLRLAATALAPGGRFVYSTHHYSLRSRYRKVPKDGRYPTNGIYRYLFSREEALAEARPFFGSVRAVRSAIYLPSVLGRLGPVSAALNRVAERLPVIDQLGELLVVSAERPTARPAESG
jgi:SAM-dependent methyltransferase